MELDGPYYSVLNFFDRVSKLERIVNVSGMMVATTKNPSGAKAKHTYQYAPNESIIATFTATTYFSHDLQPPAAAPVQNRRRRRRDRDGYEADDNGILAIALRWRWDGLDSKAAAQNPDAIDNARSVAKSLQQKQANDSDAALNAAGVPAANTASKPAPGAPAPAVKPAAIPGESHRAAPPKPAAIAAAPVSKPVASPRRPACSGSDNQLQKVNVVPGSADIQIEISSTQAVTPKVSKLSSPARVLVELPETVVATAQSKIPVGSGGVKGVRIGMDGKNPPTTSVVVDLEKALAYDVAPGPAGKVILILHTQGGRRPSRRAHRLRQRRTPAPATSEGILADSSSRSKAA